MEAECVKRKDDIDLFGAGGQPEKMGQLFRGEGDGGEASRATSRPASPSKSPSLEGGEDAVVNDEVQDLTRRVVEVSIDGEAEEEDGDQTKAIDPDMVLERLVRKEEKVSPRGWPNARTVPSRQDVRVDSHFTKQSSAAGGEQMGKQHQKAPGVQAQPAPFFNCPALNEDFGLVERGPAGPQKGDLLDESINRPVKFPMHPTPL